MDSSSSLGAPLLDGSQRDSMSLSLAADEDAEIKQYYKEMKEKHEKRNYWFMIIGTGTLKMTWETLHVAVVTFFLQRFYLITYLSILLIAYGFAQSFGSVLAGQLVKKYRANRVLAASMFVVAIDVAIILVIEAAYGGTFQDSATWDPVWMFPLGIVMGICEGATELARRVISPLIVSGDEEQLEKLNSAIHIAWGLFGAIGAFTSMPMVSALSYVFAMIHIPVVLGIGITFILLVKHEPPKQTKAKVEYYTAKDKCAANLRGFKNGVKDYFLMIKTGAQIIFTKGYWWIVVCYTLPQIIYYLLESVFFSVYANDVLMDYSLPGVFLGSANVGEMIGAILHFTLGPRVKEFFWWTRGYALFLNIFWFFPFIYTDTPLTFALAMIPPIACLNAGWSSSDISILSYIQNSFPEDEKNPENNKLPAVIGFLYTLFSLTAAVLSLAIGEVLDVFLVSNRLREGFIYLPATWLSAMSVLVMVVTFTVKKPKPVREGHH